jgi:hypothetical protein
MNFRKIFLVIALFSLTMFNLAAQEKPKTSVVKPTGAFFALSVANVDELSKWYQEKLGFKVLISGEAPNKIAKFAILQTDGALIELIQHRDAKPMSVAAPSIKESHLMHGIFKIGMLVDDLDAVYQSIKERKVTIAYEIMPAKDVPMRSFIIRDGEGNLVQFFGK